MGSQIRINFLGIRALHAAPSKHNVLFGGNSGCIAVDINGDVLFFNAGFGINSCGDELIQAYLVDKKPIESHIFFSDYFWDNTVGLPFFTPIHFKSSKIHLYGPTSSAHIDEMLSHVSSPDFSPFNGLASFPSQISTNSTLPCRFASGWLVSKLTHSHAFAPYPAAVWTLRHESGYKIAISANAILNSEERKRIAQELVGFDLLIQAAIAPKTSHPSMGGRFTFDQAASFAKECRISKLMITGVHPTLKDLDLTLAEETLQKVHQDQKGFQVSIAKETSPVHISVPSQFTKAG